MATRRDFIAAARLTATGVALVPLAAGTLLEAAQQAELVAMFA